MRKIIAVLVVAAVMMTGCGTENNTMAETISDSVSAAAETEKMTIAAESETTTVPSEKAADDKAILDEFVETVRAAYKECVENESFDKLDEIEELSPIFYYGKVNSKSTGYCYIDMDGDGTEELLFGENGKGEWNGVIYGIYTVRDGKVHCVEYGGERHTFYYCGNGIIENQGSAAAWYSYHKFYNYSDGCLELIEAVICDGERSFDEPFFHMTAGQTEEEAVPISEEKALKIIESYDTVDVEFTPFIEAVDDKAILDEFLERVSAVYVERVETGNYDKLDEIEEFLGDPFYYGERDYQSMGYCYMDIDSNGTEELIFGAINPIDGRTAIYNVATVRDGKIFQPVEGWTRNSFWYCGDGVIGNYSSGGASHNIYNFYKYNDGELELIEAFNFDYDKTGENYCFHIKAGQTDDEVVKISKEKRDKIVEEYGRVKIDLIQFVNDTE